MHGLQRLRYNLESLHWHIDLTFSVANNVSLRPFNSFGLDVCAHRYCTVQSLPDLEQALAFARANNLRIVILGAGSNVILLHDLQALVIRIDIQGIEATGNRITVMAGVNWHQLVLWTISQNLYGLENLALIPGLVGAAPIQNIGAYGVELSDRIVELTVMELTSGKSRQMSATDCGFGYRRSIFRNSPQELVVTSITLELDTSFRPVLEYADLKSRFGHNTRKLSAAEVSQAVIEIRNRKLPDPKLIGNVGSFFKNTAVTLKQLDQIRKRLPDIKIIPLDDGLYKLPVAKLIDSLGLKGKSVGDACVSEQHALVLANRGEARPEDVITLANLIIAEVNERFDIKLEIEPIILD